MNFKVLAEKLGLDEEEYIELLELLVSTSNAALEKLQAAVEKDDIEEVAKIGHSLKGSLSSLGLTNISETARMIEKDAKKGSLKETSKGIEDIREKLDQLSNAVNK